MWRNCSLKCRLSVSSSAALEKLRRCFVCSKIWKGEATVRRPKVAENVTVGSVWECVGLKTLKTWHCSGPKLVIRKGALLRVRRFKTAHQETWIRRKSDHTQDVHVGTSTSLFDLRSYFILHVVQIKCMTSCMLSFFFFLLCSRSHMCLSWL